MKIKNYVKKRTYAFRQWTRKPYAVFNSLKLTIKISVMCVAYTLINPVQESKAQTDSTQVATQHELDTVEVTGQRAPVVHSQMARIVSVITRSEIEQAPAICISDLLRSVPQVDVRQRGANGVQADVSIQGGSFDQTLILLNGINFTDPQTGHHNLNLPLDLSSIDRIEVLKGPASRVFGANAFSGAVNFVTGLETTNYVKSMQTVGDYGLYQGSVSLNQHNQSFNNFISASKSQSNGYIHNTNYDTKNLFYHGKAFINKGSIGYQLGYTTKEFGSNSFYTPSFPNQYEYTTTYLASLNGETTVGSVKFTPTIYWRRNYDHYILDYTNPKFYQNFHYTDVFGTGLNSTLTSSFGKTSLGFEYRKEIIYSTRLGKPLEESVKIPGQDSIRYTYGRWRENLGFFLEHNLYLNRFSASAGLMANRYSRMHGMELYPGIDLAYQLVKPVKFYSSVNRSLRLPTFTDLYYSGPQNTPNPNLKPEKAWTFETGLKYNLKVVSGNISYFHRWAYDVIDWVRKTSADKWTTVNFTKINTDGIELFASFEPKEISPALAFVKELNISYSFTNLNKNKDTVISYYALDNLKQKLVLTLTHSIWKNVSASWTINAQHRNGTYDDYLHYNPVTNSYPQLSYKPFVLVDGKIFYNKGMIKAFVEASNIFNVNYFDIGNIVQPGRWFKVGLELKVGWK
jgi:iron complex outermembrane receptor protein